MCFLMVETLRGSMQKSNHDTLSETPDESTSDILVMGETLIDFIPDRPGTLSTVETFHRRAGGAPANVAVRLAELDLSPWFWTRIGDDEFGSFLHQTLTDNGLTDRFMIRDDTRSTALAFVSHDHDADRQFNFYRTKTADIKFDEMTIPDGLFLGASVFHMSLREQQCSMSLSERRRTIAPLFLIRTRVLNSGTVRMSSLEYVETRATLLI